MIRSISLFFSVALVALAISAADAQTNTPTPQGTKNPVVTQGSAEPQHSLAGGAGTMPNNAELQAQQAILDRLKKKGTPGVAPDRRQPAAPAAATERPRCSGQSCISSPSVAPLFGEQPHESYGFKDNVDFAAVAAAVEQAGAPVVLLPEVPSAVRLSRSDVNRITCQDGEIQDIIYSKEKGITISSAGKDAYLKYSYVKKGMKNLYPPVTEIFITCGDATYNIIAVPERIPSQTIRLSSGVRDRIKKNQSLYSGMSSEKRILSLIKVVYSDEIPPSFTVQQDNSTVDIFKDLEVKLNRVVFVDGEGIRLKEYIIGLRPGSAVQKIALDERQFLNVALTTNTLAVSLDNLVLKRGENVRLYICEANKTREEGLLKAETTYSIDKGTGQGGREVVKDGDTDKAKDDEQKKKAPANKDNKVDKAKANKR